MYPQLQRTIDSFLPQLERLPKERTRRLDALVDFIQQALQAARPARLNFICTHNSRRSHLAQLWAQTAAAHFGVDQIETFSGGTEATAFNPRAVAAIERNGFVVEDPGGDNPHYLVRFAPDTQPQICFSKTYDDPMNPHENFAAVMTCTDADQNCPVVLGASARLSLPYDDPKAADGTAEEAARYDERSRQVAIEMFYALSKVSRS